MQKLADSLIACKAENKNLGFAVGFRAQPNSLFNKSHTKAGATEAFKMLHHLHVAMAVGIGLHHWAKKQTT